MGEYQDRVRRLYEERGYTNDKAVLVCGLCEEIGEIAAAVLDQHPLYKPKPNRRKNDPLDHELKDALAFLCALANAADVNLGI